MPIIHYTNNSGRRVVSDAVLIELPKNPGPRDLYEVEKQLEALFPKFKVYLSVARDTKKISRLRFEDKKGKNTLLFPLMGDFVVRDEDGKPTVVAPWSVLQSSGDFVASVSPVNLKDAVRDAWQGKEPSGLYEVPQRQAVVESSDVTALKVPRFSGDFDQILGEVSSFLSGSGMKPVISFKASYSPTKQLKSFTVAYHALNKGLETEIFPGDTIIKYGNKYIVERH